MNYIPGIDVSHWQGEINWSKVRADGKRFVFIKATEGTSLVDSTYERNWRAARQDGLLRGAYHFFRPLQDAQRQADLFLDTLNLEAGDLPPVLDLEVSDNLRSATLIQRVEIWVNAVQNAVGQAPIIYSGVAFLNDNFTIAAGGPPLWAKNSILWIANYRGAGAAEPIMPAGWPRWHFWQHTASGQVSGIQGKVDLNWFNGTLEELFVLAGKDAAGKTIPRQTTYSVKPGDSLQAIAIQFGIDLKELVEANPNLLQPGTVLNIPAGSEQGGGVGSGKTETRPGRDAPEIYVVKLGDSLSAIAARFDTTVAALVTANQISHPDRITVGQRLIIP